MLSNVLSFRRLRLSMPLSPENKCRERCFVDVEGVENVTWGQEEEGDSIAGGEC